MIQETLLDKKLDSVVVTASSDFVDCPSIDDPLFIRLVKLRPGQLRFIVTRDPQIDPIFFYYCDLDDSSFNTLREQQRLEFDFSHFSQKVEELLNDCQTDSSMYGEFFLGTSPRFGFVARTKYGRHAELSLNLMRASDDILAGFLAARLSHSVAEVDALRKQLHELQRDYDTRSIQFDAKINELISINENLEEEKIKISQNLEEKVNQGQVEIERLLKESSDLKTEIERLSLTNAKSVAQLEGQISDLTRDNGSLRLKIEDFQSEIDRLKSTLSLKETEIQSLNQSITSLKDQNSELNNVIQGQKSQLNSLSDHKSSTNSELSSLKTKFDNLSAENLDLTAALEEANARLVEYREGLDRARHGRREASRTADEMRSRAERVEEELEEASNAVQQEKMKFLEVTEELKKAHSEISQLKEQNSKQTELIQWYSKEISRLERPRPSSTRPPPTPSHFAKDLSRFSIDQEEERKVDVKYSFTPSSLERSRTSAKYRPRRLAQTQ
ncbi:hypothetical protein P9112_008904 [Eukaryota sp. TZLM1-RC]